MPIPDMQPRLSRRSVAHLGIAAAIATPLTQSSVHAQAVLAKSLFTEDFRAQLATWMEELAVPGAAIGLAYGDVRETATFGITNVDDPQSISRETLFQIGSISKTYTATALMHLIEVGKIKLDDLLRTFIPEFTVADPVVSAEVKIRNLVTHTTGFEVDPPIEGTDGDDALALLMGDTSQLPQIAPLDGPFSYSNLNAAVLGRVLEVIDDRVFEEVIQDYVFDRLGLRNSYYDATTISALPHAVGHDVDDAGKAIVLTEGFELPRIARPAGGITSSIEDLLTFGMFHGSIGDDISDVITAESVADMQSELVPGGSLGQIRCDGIGVAWFTFERDGVKLIAHGGGTVGQQSLLVIAPDENFVFAMLTNADSGSDLVLMAARWMLNHHLGTSVLDDKPGQEVDAAGVTDCFGTYTGPDGYSMTVETGFVAEGPPRIVILDNSGEEPVFLDSLEDDVWFSQGTYSREYVDFVRNDQGNVGWIRVSGRLTPKVG